jgi:hypothetical protein
MNDRMGNGNYFIVGFGLGIWIYLEIDRSLGFLR